MHWRAASLNSAWPCLEIILGGVVSASFFSHILWNPDRKSALLQERIAMDADQFTLLMGSLIPEKLQGVFHKNLSPDADSFWESVACLQKHFLLTFPGKTVQDHRFLREAFKKIGNPGSSVLKSALVNHFLQFHWA